MALFLIMKEGEYVKDYYIKVVANISKEYYIESKSSEEAISTALDYFTDFVTDDNDGTDTINGIKFEVEDIIDIDDLYEC